MGTAVGQQLVFGIAEETTWGTPVVVSRFYDILNESNKLTQVPLQSNALRGGTRNARQASRRRIATRSAAGEVKLELVTNGMGLLLKHIMGSTPTVVQQAATAAYLQTHNLGAQLGKSFTMQKQLRDGSGTAVKTFTYPGTKITSAEFSIAAGNLFELNLGLDSMDEQTSVAAATPAFLAGHPYSFKDAALKFDGTPVANVTAASVKLENSLKTDRYFVGGNGLKSEQMDNGFAMPTGKLTAEFLDSTLYDKYTADTAISLVFEFIGANIASTYFETFRITLPEIHLLGDTPTVGGPELVSGDYNFEALATGASVSAMKIEYMSTDTAV